MYTELEDINLDAASAGVVSNNVSINNPLSLNKERVTRLITSTEPSPVIDIPNGAVTIGPWWFSRATFCHESYTCPKKYSEFPCCSDSDYCVA